ncbi:MAG: LppX_LprAFG lipoprotein [Anaerolineales bacterium]
MNSSKSIQLHLIVALILAGCSAPIEDLPPEAIVERSAEFMRSLEGFSFRLERTGQPVYVDPGGLISFRQAEGIFVSPDRVQATVKVIAPAIVAEVSIIGIGDLEWETNIFSGEWALVPPEYAFQPAVLFDPIGGIHQALEDYLVNIELIGIAEIDEIPGLSLYYLSGQMDGSNVHDLTVGLIDEQLLEIELWIAPNTFELHRVVIIDPVNDHDELGTNWIFDFWDFGKIIEIEPPV